ncbi:MAG TPA: hypothetical protein VFV50_18255 [Bdellovibrionales bacterium]|nr:hypothetical protein [Bdellovibrionales bacterium]
MKNHSSYLLSLFIIIAAFAAPASARVIQNETRSESAVKYEGHNGWTFVQIVTSERTGPGGIYRELVIQNKPGATPFNEFEYVFTNDKARAARIHKDRRSAYQIIVAAFDLEVGPALLETNILRFRVTRLDNGYLKLETAMRSSGMKFPDALLWRRGS